MVGNKSKAAGTELPSDGISVGRRTSLSRKGGPGKPSPHAAQPELDTTLTGLCWSVLCCAVLRCAVASLRSKDELTLQCGNRFDSDSLFEFRTG